MSVSVDQIQSLVFTGFGTLPWARVLLMESVAGGDLKGAAARMAARVAFGKPRTHFSEAVQLAWTMRGLAALGLPKEACATFPDVFRELMEEEHHKRVLGDEQENDPVHWDWSGDRLDGALMVYANSQGALEELCRVLGADMEGAYRVVRSIDMALLDDTREHFGFHDGISQPALSELSPKAPAEDRLATGELILGYADESGEIPPVPMDGAVNLGRDGTFLVLRQLEQDVAGFWNMVRGLTGSDEEAVWLASKMVGRWPDGTPVGAASTVGGKRDPDAAPKYARDPWGLGCPLGAHVRRANARDGIGLDAGESFAKMRRHRLLRRGRPYGPPAPAEVFPAGVRVSVMGGVPGAAGDGRGLCFICLCADIARQFEMVQQTWLNNVKNGGLYDEVCPISSGRGLHGDSQRFTVPEDPIRRRYGSVPRFVRVRGSAYLFLMGKSALMHLVH